MEGRGRGRRVVEDDGVRVWVVVGDQHDGGAYEVVVVDVFVADVVVVGDGVGLAGKAYASAGAVREGQRKLFDAAVAQECFVVEVPVKAGVVEEGRAGAGG